MWLKCQQPHVTISLVKKVVLKANYANIVGLYGLAHGQVIRCIAFLWDAINSLWPSDAIWSHVSGSTLAQVMACCLTAPSHYLNHCWLIIIEDFYRDYFVHAPSQWEMTLQCNIVLLAGRIYKMIPAFIHNRYPRHQSWKSPIQNLIQISLGSMS